MARLLATYGKKGSVLIIWGCNCMGRWINFLNSCEYNPESTFIVISARNSLLQYYSVSLNDSADLKSLKVTLQGNKLTEIKSAMKVLHRELVRECCCIAENELRRSSNVLFDTFAFLDSSEGSQTKEEHYIP